MESTKELIIKAALKDFATEGYESTSVRTIANQVGITAGALYKHFKNKHEIFITIVDWMNEEYEKSTEKIKVPHGNIEDKATAYAGGLLGSVKYIVIQRFRYWTEDEYAICYRRMLTLEQFRNTEMAELYQKYFVGGIIDFGTSMFKSLMEKGVFKEGNPQLLSLEFYSPFFTLLSLSDSLGNNKIPIEALEKHIDYFAMHHVSHTK